MDFAVPSRPFHEARPIDTKEPGRMMMWKATTMVVTLTVNRVWISISMPMSRSRWYPGLGGQARLVVCSTPSAASIQSVHLEMVSQELTLWILVMIVRKPCLAFPVCHCPHWQHAASYESERNLHQTPESTQWMSMVLNTERLPHIGPKHHDDSTIGCHPGPA